MREEEKGHLEIEDRAADNAQDTKGAAIMRTNDTPNKLFLPQPRRTRVPK
jgi:hypothetical protein